MTTKCFPQPATIFSCVRQPLWDKERTSERQKSGDTGWVLLSVLNCPHPPPLISVRSPSTSSAPSITTSSCVGGMLTYYSTRQIKRNCFSAFRHSAPPVMFFFFCSRTGTISTTLQFKLTEFERQRIAAPSSRPRLSDSFVTSSSYLWVPVQIRQREAVLHNQLASLWEDKHRDGTKCDDREAKSCDTILCFCFFRKDTIVSYD